MIYNISKGNGNVFKLLLYPCKICIIIFSIYNNTSYHRNIFKFYSNSEHYKKTVINNMFKLSHINEKNACSTKWLLFICKARDQSRVKIFGHFTKLNIKKMDSSQNTVWPKWILYKIQCQKNGLFTKFQCTNMKDFAFSRNSAARNFIFWQLVSNLMIFWGSNCIFLFLKKKENKIVHSKAIICKECFDSYSRILPIFRWIIAYLWKRIIH